MYLKKVPHIVNALAKGYWLIEGQAAKHYLPVVLQYLSGGLKAFDDTSDTQKEPVMPLIMVKGEQGWEQIKAQANKANVFESAPSGSVAIINVKGAIMKDDYCDEPGTSTMKTWVSMAASSDNISAIIIDTDSPGGAVDGTFEFSDEIGRASSQKPVIAYVNGLAASAGYGIISQASHIMASHNAARIGSIGTMVTLFNWEEYDKRVGIKEITIYAEDSKDKNQAYHEALKGNEALIKEEILNPLNDVFLNTVRKGREGKLQESKSGPLTGKLYMAQDAIKIGLVDSIGTFNDALQLASDLNQTKAAKEVDTNMKHSFKASWLAVLAIFGLTAQQGQQSVEKSLSAEDINKMSEKLEELTTANTQLTTENEKLSKTVADQASEITELKKTPGASQTIAHVKGDDIVESEKENQFLTSFDNEKATLKAKGII